MFFRSLAFVTAIASASAGKSVEIPTNDISATSNLGRGLLSKARALENNDGAYTWVSGYSIKFEKCATSQDYYGGYFGGEGGNNNNNNNNNRNGFNGMYQQRLVHFKLCPSNSCSTSCTNGAEYVIDMNDFVEAYIESKLTAQEYDCEKQRESCEYSCQNANDDQTCESNCYVNAGMDYCVEENNQNNNNNQGVNFQLEDAVECKRLDIDKDALQYYFYNNGGSNNNAYNNYNYNRNGGGNGEMELFVGPYCSKNGKSIHLGVFMDETCSFGAPSGIYEKLNYGQTLPYSSENLIDSNCVSCKEPAEYDENNNGDQQDADEVTEVCERLYEESGKCETNLGSVTAYPNTYACDFIKTLKAGGGTITAKNSAIPAKTFAGVFAVTTVMFAGVSYWLHQKLQRSNVNLADSGVDGQLA